MGLLHHIRYFKSVVREKAKELTRSSKWPSTRKNFLKSNPTCAACGAREKLQVHHVKPFHLHPELELDSENLITLCMGPNECHLQIGHGDDYKCYNPNVRENSKEVLRSPNTMKVIIELAKANRLKAG